MLAKVLSEPQRLGLGPLGLDEGPECPCWPGPHGGAWASELETSGRWANSRGVVSRPRGSAKGKGPIGFVALPAASYEPSVFTTEGFCN